MDICVFQGTFNPIHNAHLRIAEYTLKNLATEGVIFIPAYCPPHKESVNSMAQHRYNMVEAAIKYNPKFYISDIEYRRKGKSYTYLTICELIEKFKPANKIKFIIGTDAFRKIETWYEADKLKTLVDFLVFPRENKFCKNDLNYLAEKGYNFTIIPLEFEDVSSTKLRSSIKCGKPLHKYLPQKVEEYIKENDLYKD